MFFYYGFDKYHAQACAHRLRRAGCGKAPVAFEQMLLVVGTDAVALIRYFKHKLGAAHRHRDGNLRMFRAVFDGVGQQVDCRTREHGTVCVDWRRLAIELKHDFNVFGTRIGPHFVNAFLRDFAQVDCRKFILFGFGA